MFFNRGGLASALLDPTITKLLQQINPSTKMDGVHDSCIERDLLTVNRYLRNFGVTLFWKNSNLSLGGPERVLSLFIWDCDSERNEEIEDLVSYVSTDGESLNEEHEADDTEIIAIISQVQKRI